MKIVKNPDDPHSCVKALKAALKKKDDDLKNKDGEMNQTIQEISVVL